MGHDLHALVLAAGYGSRLRPLTLDKPKCLVEVWGKPLLGHWLDKLEDAGCRKVIVNTHYLAWQVEDFLDNWEGDMKIKTSYEEVLLGTAGTLRNNLDLFENGTGLMIHADNIMKDGLDEFLNAHEQRVKGSVMTMLTFNTDNPKSSGIVVVDENDVMVNFFEKVEEPPGRKANGAVYAFGRELSEHFKASGDRKSDFSLDVIPELVGRVQTWHYEGYYMDIGTPSALEKAQSDWGKMI